MDEQLLPKSIVTPDDYKNFTGKDLFRELRETENDSNFPYAFLGRVQDYLIHWCSQNGFRVMTLDKMSPVQIIAFKKAIICQTEYAIINGYVALGMDMGMDKEQGKIMPVPPIVLTYLHESGLFNLKMKNRPRVTRGYPWMGSNEY